MKEFHQPVLVEELLELLKPEPGQVIVDATVGGGGHALAMLLRLKGEATLIGIDRDPDAIRFSAQRLSRFGPRVKLIKGRFSQLSSLLEQRGIKKIDRIYFDLGVSSHQLDTPERGFSFMRPGPLDMRMDPEQGEPASELLKKLSEKELERIFREYGEERFSKRVARAIVEKRRQGLSLERTQELAKLIEAELPKRRQRVHPATRIFQALRIYINQELEELREGLRQALSLLGPQGRMAVISYHSLEDREVKSLFRAREKAGEVMVLTKKPIGPGQGEIQENPRSRSAKLRACVKISSPKERQNCSQDDYLMQRG